MHYRGNTEDRETGAYWGLLAYCWGTTSSRGWDLRAGATLIIGDYCGLLGLYWGSTRGLKG